MQYCKSIFLQHWSYFSRNYLWIRTKTVPLSKLTVNLFSLSDVECTGDYVVVLPDWFSHNVTYGLDNWIRQYKGYNCEILIMFPRTFWAFSPQIWELGVESHYMNPILAYDFVHGKCVNRGCEFQCNFNETQWYCGFDHNYLSEKLNWKINMVSRMS